MIDSKRECETSVSPNSLTKQINLKNNFFKRKLKVIRCLELLDQ